MSKYIYFTPEEKARAQMLLCKQVAKFLQIKSKNKGLKNIPFTSTGKGV